jgi:hypothetical protein
MAYFPVTWSDDAVLLSPFVNGLEDCALCSEASFDRAGYFDACPA